ncbi:ABC transporter permease protein YxdM [Clostridium ljungdahlii DSM 13528]|uniref:ABC transporter permease protein YxdM n=2 Tax=Clostridium ljungdahlii (strain ATCC 55383 / DSM 13528 / PETC) TaxID=748727 RepID=A0ABX2TVR6_CLOLD|nr:FtsX-like permease family protein [Clostridium ljungdahlii]OAA88070.1 ABC transporter permease protein YxdM [Clostridium ljungdahlii DSM 13528]
MNSFSIAYNNFKHNIKTYALNLMAMIFSVAVYYNFIALNDNPQIVQINEIMNIVRSASTSTAVLLLVFLVFFIWYSNSFFLKQKKKEIGIYAFMGIDNYKIGLIYALEGFLQGLLSIVIGSFVGILFSKLFIMILCKVAFLDVKINFFISVHALIETIITFLIIFFIISVLGYFNIVRSKLIDLFNASRKQEGLPKLSKFKAAASIIIILIAYGMCISLPKLAVIGSVPIITIMIIFATYWLFGSFFSMIMRYILDKKQILYNGTNIVSISNIVFRIKENYKTLATIAILIASAITALGTAASIKYNTNIELDLPYSFTYILDGNTGDEIEPKVNKYITSANHNILLKEKVNFIFVNKSKTDENFSEDEFMVVKASDFKKITKDLKVKDAEGILQKSELKSGEVIYVQRPKTLVQASKIKNIEINNLKYNVKMDLKTPLFGGIINDPCLVVNDKDYEAMKGNFKESKFYGIIVNDQKNTLDLSAKLRTIRVLDNNLYSYAQKYRSGYEAYGVIFFMGCFLALVFVVATGSIIHFKILSEAYMDKEKYKILLKIGMTERELKSTISKQTAVYFILPLLVGVIHSSFGIVILSRLMDCNLLLTTAISVVTFIVIYGMFYIFTLGKFRKVI